MLAVIVVRSGALPAGALECVSECAGRAVIIGSGTSAAVSAVGRVGGQLTAVEIGDYRPAAWTDVLAGELAGEPVLVLPASADGRDLAPRLAARMNRPLYALAMTVSPGRVELIRGGGSQLHTVEPAAQFVATLQPGVRGFDLIDADAHVRTELRVVVEHDDPQLEALLPPDAATIDLAEAERIVTAGAGLDGRSRLEQLAAFGAALGASIGATRVLTDRGWLGHERQIGTTGVIVDPKLYIAFGVSGAVQHTTGLGQPEHIISVNTDPYCPMMQLADLAVVADANAVLDELTERIAARG